MKLTNVITEPALTAEPVTQRTFSQLLADQYALYLQTWQCYQQSEQTPAPHVNQYLAWQLCRLEELMEKSMRKMDRLACRKISTADEIRHLVRLQPPVEESRQPDAMLSALRNGHTSLTYTLTGNIRLVLHETKDADTGNFLAEIREHHVFMAWMIDWYLD